MLGRGALADPLLFSRLRDGDSKNPTAIELRQNTLYLLRKLLPSYRQRYCGQAQVLAKLRSLLPYLQAEGCESLFDPLRSAKTLEAFEAQLKRLENP
jgi:hypothetical protein